MARAAKRGDGLVGELGSDMPTGSKRVLALEQGHLRMVVRKGHAGRMVAQAGEVRACGRIDKVEGLCEGARKTSGGLYTQGSRLRHEVE